MALTYTPEGNIGTPLPNFTLPATNGQTYNSEVFKNGKPTVVMFICNHCPYVQAIEGRLIQLGYDFMNKADIVAICSNDPTDYEEDSFENLKKRAEELEYPFPYLFDEEQSVAKLFGAVCTPDLYIYDTHDTLAYRGRLDDSWKDASKVTKKELESALTNIINDEKVSEDEQNPSMGCSIKWK